jgi:hypothetical protein
VLRALFFCVIAGAGCARSTGTEAPRPSGSPEAAREQTERAEPRPSEPTSPPGVERFFFTGDETPCPTLARGDCRSSAELLADGTLRMDPWGEPGAPILEARVPDAARLEAFAAFRDTALLALLARPTPCSGADASETMLTRIAGTDHTGTTGMCNEPPIQSARQAIQRLTDAHFAGHSLISPPF